MKRDSAENRISKAVGPMTTAAAMVIALTSPAMAGDTADSSGPGGEEKAEAMAEHAARDGSAKTQPKESWTSGASTTPATPATPEKRAKPVEGLPADARTAEAEPATDKQLENAVDEAREDNNGRTKPKESWTSGASTTNASSEKDPGDH